MTTAILVLLGAGTVLFLSGIQCKTILQTYKDLLAGKALELTGPCSGSSPGPSSGPTFSGGTGTGQQFGGGSGGTSL